MLVDQDDWRAGIAAAQLAAAPVRAPVLLSEGDEVPEATADALDKLRPTGAKEAGGAQVIRIGDVAEPDGLKTTDVKAGEPAATARAIDRLQSAAAKSPSDSAVRGRLGRPRRTSRCPPPAGRPSRATRCCGRAATSCRRRRARRSQPHKRPRIYVLGPAGRDLREGARAQLKQARQRQADRRRRPRDERDRVRALHRRLVRLGRHRPGPRARVRLDARRTRRRGRRGAAVGAPAPTARCCWSTEAQALPQALQDYLLDIQPGYDKDPVRGVYNHGWLMGDEAAISADVQSRIDTLLEIQPVDTGGD